jgi:hypothetical protein
VKHKDWEASFRLATAEKEVEALALTTSAVKEPPPTPEEVEKFEQIAKVSPRAAILETRAELDQALREFAQAIGMKQTNRPLGSLIRDLRTHESIDHRVSAILDDLRVLGNNAAHGIDNFSFDEALRFRDIAERVMALLRVSTGAAATLGQPAPLGQLSP